MRLQKVWVAVAALTIIAGVAFAKPASAGGSLKDGPMPVSPVFNWSGYYIGGLLSYNFGESGHCDNGICNSAWPHNEYDGWMGGFTAGVDGQNGNVVFGAMVDWSWGDVSDATGSSGGFNCASGPCITELKSLGTVRGRLGYAFGNFLPYVTAGVAISNYHFGITPFTNDETVVSATGGVGLEYAFSRNLSFKVEYLYIDGGSDRLNYPTCGAAPNNCFLRVEDIQSVRLGLNYRF